MGGAVAFWHVRVRNKSQEVTPEIPTFLPDSTNPHELSGEEVYRHLLRSTAFIVTPSGLGSGVLIDSHRRLVVTNAHVVGGHEKVVVLFPAYKRDGQVITDAKHYVDHIKEIGFIAKVLTRSLKQDLALIELPTLPTEVRPVGFVKQPAPTGALVYSIGGSGADPVDLSNSNLWRLSTGTVRNRANTEHRTRAGMHKYMCLETQSPVNPGDSGGPVVNARVELVGIVASYNTNERLVSSNIDLSEVRSFVGDYFRSLGEIWKEPETEFLSPAVPFTTVLNNLIDVLKRGTAADRITAAHRLGILHAQARPAVQALLGELNTPDPELRTAIGVALGQIGPPESGEEVVLLQALSAKDVIARRYAARMFATETAIPLDGVKIVSEALKDEGPEVRILAAQALGRVGVKARPVAFGPLLDGLADKDQSVREAITAAIKAMGPPETEDRAALHARLKHRDLRVRIAVATFLVPLTTTDESVKAIVGSLKDESPEVRVLAAHAISKAGTKGRSVALGAILDGHADKDQSVREACSVALQAMSKPEHEDESVLLSRLNHTDPRVRGAVVQLLIPLATMEDAAAALAESLKDESSDVRVLAAEAICKVGTTARPVALGRLLDGFADKDKAVREACAAAVQAVGKPERSEMPILSARLRHADLRVRVAATGLLAPLATTREDALSMWVPLLKDSNAELRLAAVKALTSETDLLEGSANDLISLLPDPEPAVRRSVARAVRDLKKHPGLMESVEKRLEREDERSVRPILAESLVVLTEAKVDNLALLRRLLKDPTAPVREGAAKKIAKIGVEAAKAVPDLLERVNDESDGVRVAVLYALAAMEREAKEAIPSTADLFERSTPEPVLIAAAHLLGATGPDGVKRLETLCIRPLPAPVREEICRAFALSNSPSDAMRAWMVDQCETLTACREAVTAALVKHGNNATVQYLLRRTHLHKPRKPGEKKDTTYAPEYRKWVMATLGKMKVKAVASQETLGQLTDLLDHFAKNDANADVRAEAKITLTKLRK